MDLEHDKVELSSALRNSPSRASDRFVPRAVSGDMIVINTGFSKGGSPFPSPSKGDRTDTRDSTSRMRESLWKGIVRSPQKILSFDASDSASASASARREAISAVNIAADAPVAEANVLRSMSTDSDFSFSSTRKVLSESSESRLRHRIIQRSPFQLLRVPGMPDDFYMSPMDWSAANQIVVSLPTGIFIWDAYSTLCYTLTDKSEAERNPVRCLAWRTALHTEQLAEGLDSGVVRIRDTEKEQVIASWDVHSRRIGTCAWSPKGVLIATGSKDHTVGLIDPREPNPRSTETTHTQEVCGVKWDPDGVLLASGGNDNLLVLWDHRMMNAPLHVFQNAHRAAVKALAWSPHRHGRLVSGGGTADRRLRFWDVSTMSCIGEVDSGSQVCNVAWSANTDEIVSTHGFSQNHIVVWDTSLSTSSNVPVPSPAIPIATLRGHRSRVLHLAVSPDGRTIATCAADDRLMLWNVFPGKNAPLMLCTPAKGDLPSTKTAKTKAVRQQCSDSQSMSSSSIETALMPECSLDFR